MRIEVNILSNKSRVDRLHKKIPVFRKAGAKTLKNQSVAHTVG